MSSIWASVDQLVDCAPRLSDLREHKLHLFAARRWRALGRPLPPGLLAEERLAAINALTAALVLERVRAACDGPLILLKGPEVAARYPDPLLRPFVDVDLLVPDAHRTQRALIAAGFREIGDPALYRNIHHLRPLQLPDLPLPVEVHSAPKWIDHLTPPPLEELFSVASPALSGVDGVLALPAPHHALALVAHAWAHDPLVRLLELIDVAVMSEAEDRNEIAQLARRWGMSRVWNSTIRAADALFDDRRKTPALRLWARNLPAARGRTVLESHLERWIGAFSALPMHTAVRVGFSNVIHEFRPAAGESWRTKLGRMRLAVANAPRRRIDHDEHLEREGLDGPEARTRRGGRKADVDARHPLQGQPDTDKEAGPAKLIVDDSPDGLVDRSSPNRMQQLEL
jgi:hypothetical protein